MIDTFLKTIINELGPIGLLIVGLYFVLGKHLKEISYHIKVINLEIGRLEEALKSCTDRICDKLDGKN